MLTLDRQNSTWVNVRVTSLRILLISKYAMHEGNVMHLAHTCARARIHVRARFDVSLLIANIEYSNCRFSVSLLTGLPTRCIRASHCGAHRFHVPRFTLSRIAPCFPRARARVFSRAAHILAVSPRKGFRLRSSSRNPVTPSSYYCCR